MADVKLANGTSSTKPTAMAGPKEASSSDDYILDRLLFSSIRLNLQHFLRVKEQGYLIHPNIPLDDPNIHIADIGTGTGVWLLDAASSLPSTAQLWGSDIDLSQLPAQELLPPNITFDHLDIINGDIPPQLQNRFDIVHIRFLLLVITSEDEATRVLQNLIKLLKPGGWIQWQEAQRNRGQFVYARDGLTDTTHRELLALLRSIDPRTQPTSWISNLRDLFVAEGLCDVLDDGKTSGQYGVNNVWHTYAHETVLGIAVELQSRLPPGELRSGIARLVPLVAKEIKDGVLWTSQMTLCIGRKPGVR